MALPLPPLGVSSAVVPFIIVAISMIGITIFVLGKVLPRDRKPPLVTQMLLALAVLCGGSVLLFTLLDVFYDPNGTTAWTWVLLGFNFMMMAPAGIWFIGLIVFRDRRIKVDDWSWPIAIALATTGAEVLMGLLFVAAGTSGALSALVTVALGLSSIWFFWSMAAIMTALLLWAPLGPVERGALVALTISAVIGPWVTTFPLVGGAAMAALMAGVFAYLVRAVALSVRVHAEEVGLLIGLAVAFLATALTGVALAATDGSAASIIAFGTVMAVVMTVEIAYLVRRFYLGPPARPWVDRLPEEGEEPAPASAPVPEAGAERANPEPSLAPGS